MKRSNSKENSSPESRSKKLRKDDTVKRKILVKTDKKSVQKKQISLVELKAKDGATDGKPNWEELKQKNKELKKKRKEQKCPNYILTVNAKKLWEKLRREDCSAQLRNELNIKLFALLKNELQKVVFAHDMARVVQWLLKLGEPNIRHSIVDALEPVLISMVQSKYSSFCVSRMLKYGSNESRHKVIQSFLGNVVKLTSHSIASPILEFAYSNYASPTQKNQMKQELYSDLYKHGKENDVHSLGDVFSKSPGMKSSILASTKSNLLRILNKKLIKSSLVLSVLLDILNHASVEDRDELLVAIRPHIMKLISSKDGVRVAMKGCWFGTTKDKKNIMKTLKGHVVETAMCEHGHFFLLALFDSVDDTVFLKKTVIAELIPNLKEVAFNEYGRKVVLYLIAHRNPHYFHPSLIDLLKIGDESDTIKKSMDIREEELKQLVLTPLLSSVSTHTSHWFSSSSIIMVTLAVLNATEVAGIAREEALTAVAKYLCDCNAKLRDKDKECSIVEHSGAHLVFKKLILNDKEVAAKGNVLFSSLLLLELTEDILMRWLTVNRACFLLVNVIETGIPAVQKKLKKLMNAKLKNILRSQKSVGATILDKKLKELKSNKAL